MCNILKKINFKLKPPIGSQAVILMLQNRVNCHHFGVKEIISEIEYYLLFSKIN